MALPQALASLRSGSGQAWGILLRHGMRPGRLLPLNPSTSSGQVQREHVTGFPVPCVHLTWPQAGALAGCHSGAVDVGLLGAISVVLKADGIAHLVQEFLGTLRHSCVPF